MVPTLYTLIEVAKVFHVSIHAVRQWTARGKLPTVRVGRRVLVKEDDLARLIEAARRPGGGDV